MGATASRRGTESGESGTANLPHPQGWTRGLTNGWATFVFMAIFGLLTVAGGLAMCFDLAGAERAVAIGILAMGCGLLSGIAAWRPWGLRRLQVRSAEVDGEHGVMFPGSSAISLMCLVGGGLVTAAGVVLLTAPEVSGKQRVFGAALAVLAGFVALLGLRRLVRGWWKVYLLPSGVAMTTGTGRAVLPWKAIERVSAQEIVTHARGVAIREQFIGIVANDPKAIKTGRYNRAAFRANRAFGAHVSIPVRALRGHPTPLFYALHYYREHPELRTELADGRALDRIRRGELIHRY